MSEDKTGVLATLEPPVQSTFEQVFAEVFGVPEFSGRYCEICEDTTPHARLRGKYRKNVKTIRWLCSPCLSPGGALYEIVVGLMQKEPTP